MLKRLDHVSIGVLDMDKARALFCEILGGEILPDAGESEVAGFDWITFMLGGKKVELVTPKTPGEGGIGQQCGADGFALASLHDFICASHQRTDGGDRLRQVLVLAPGGGTFG